MSGKLLAIAVKSKEDGNMHLCVEAEVSTLSGVANDPRGMKTSRQVTVLSTESWNAACAELGTDLPWTARRANLLVENIELLDSKGKTLVIGNVEMVVTFETKPCYVMDQAQEGLLDALVPDWRGGVLCKVIKSGHIIPGDTVQLI